MAILNIRFNRVLAGVILSFFLASGSVGVRSATAAEAKPLEVDVFWSMRSPYCYIALDRILEMRKKYNIKMNFRPVWPIAIWNPEFFKGIKFMKYRVPYQDLDTARSAFFNKMPYAYPTPDPVKQAPNFGPVKPMKEQDLIKTLTYTAAAAAEMGKGWDYLNQVSRMMWNGTVVNWDKGTHLRDAIQRAGIDADTLLAEIAANPAKYDALVKRNHDLQTTNLAGHTGVPTFVFNKEPFFGQDRMDQLLWRLKRFGLTERGR
jgi:2-hydroxychromene-2-carboxylate isomerase